MSKVGGAIPSWYWPTGVPRRIGVAPQALEWLVRRQATSAKERPALVWAGGRLIYGELLEQALSVAGGIQKRGLGGTIAVAEASGPDALVLLLAALLAEKRVLVTDPIRGVEEQAAHLKSAEAAAIITASGAGPGAERSGLPVLDRAELSDAYRQSARPRRALDPAVLIPGERGVVVHSHFFITAMCTSLATFIPQLRELGFVCLPPPDSWEAVVGMFGALLQGMPIVFPDREGKSSGALGGDRASYTMLLRSQADEVLRRRRRPAPLAGLRYIFVSTGRFDLAWRQRLEKLLGQAILPVWGLVEVGPIVAPHPTWFPAKAHGFPLVNVSLVPVDPASGKVSLVPWEMLDQAEACVETLSGMIGYAGGVDATKLRVGKLFRTHQMASMDNVGVVTLHGEVPRGATHAS
jgi:acyl-CoA synthetase (AMP-forming)/AMP-acid ligase II